MNVREFLGCLRNAYSHGPADEIVLRWNPHLARWEASLTYWHLEGHVCGERWKPTPEEAVRHFLGVLKGRELYRSGQNGNWGRYTVEEEITCDDMAFLEGKETPPLVEGENVVLRDRALSLAKDAKKVFLRTYVGDRPIKGYPEEQLVERDRGGKGWERVLKILNGYGEHDEVTVGLYENGDLIGLHGGLL